MTTSMEEPTIDALCAEHFNENPHTEHVTRLALRLFDATRAALEIPARQRRLLEAAGRLHDMAYRVNPVHHVTTSAEIVLERGLYGYRAEDLPLIAGVMLLHGGNLVAAQNELIFHEMTDAQRERVLRLGAFLRIADGLDYGHVQDAVITGVRVHAKVVIVKVASPNFPVNLARANRKADLWREVFARDIQFEAVPGGGPLLAPDMPVSEAARRLFSLSYKKMLVNIDGALAGEDPETLRQVRVGLRRLRLLLRVFRKRLPKDLVEPIESGLSELGDELGRARDLDVWLGFLQGEATRSLAQGRLWTPFYRHQCKLREMETATIRRGLRGAHFGALRHKITRLTRTELPRLTLEAPGKPGSLPVVARKRWQKMLRRVRRKSKLRHSTSGDKLHELRTTMRRARYVGDFFGELLEPRDRKLVKRLRAAEKLLGRVHDINVALETFVPAGPMPPRALVRLLRKEHADCLNRLERAWERMGL